MFRLFSSLLVLPVFCVSAFAGTITHGVVDQFKTPVEPTTQGSWLLAISSGPWADFDYPAADRRFGHTITNLPCSIGSATLVMDLRSTSTLSINDTIALATTGGTPAFAWSRRLRDLLPGDWNTPGEVATLTLNLAALPTASGGSVNLLDVMNASGELDIYMQDDTSVDFITLTTSEGEGTDCNQNGIPDSCEDIPILMDCPSNINVAIREQGECCANVTLDVSATDLCGSSSGIEITNDYSSGAATKRSGYLSACFPVGQTTVTFTATDSRGNSVSCATTITVTDAVPPTILSCPEL